VFSRDRNGIGIGGELPGNGAHLLEKDSWSAAVVDELEQLPEDIKADKCRISGFWDTPLDSILKNLDVKTLFFSGVNTDQCVLHSLTDAHFLG
jgi:nicotinamidase-related amidase